MNLTPGQAHEAYIGPPSEPVKVAEFLESAVKLEEEHRNTPIFSQSGAALREDLSWSSLSQAEMDGIKAECWYVANAAMKHVQGQCALTSTV